MTNAHISDLVTVELVTQGFTPVAGIRHVVTFERRAPVTAAYEGALGTTILQTITVDKTGRWLSRVDGWGTVLNDVDLRRYNRTGGAPAAIADVMRQRDDMAAYVMKGPQIYDEPPHWVFLDRFGDELRRVASMPADAMRLICAAKNIEFISAAKFSAILNGEGF
jgi:hypothetical protein